MVISTTKELSPVTIAAAQEVVLFDGISDALKVHDLWLSFAAQGGYAAVLEVVGYKNGNEVFVEPATFSNQANTGFRSNSFPATQNNLSIARGAIMLDGWDGSGMQTYVFPNRMAGVVDKITARIKSFSAATWAAFNARFEIDGTTNEQITKWRDYSTNADINPPIDWITGTPFTVTQRDTPFSTGFSLDQTYYLCQRTGTAGLDTKFRVALTYADALAGNVIDLVNNGTGKQTNCIVAAGTGSAKLWARLKSCSHPV